MLGNSGTAGESKLNKKIVLIRTKKVLIRTKSARLDPYLLMNLNLPEKDHASAG